MRACTRLYIDHQIQGHLLRRHHDSGRRGGRRQQTRFRFVVFLNSGTWVRDAVPGAKVRIYFVIKKCEKRGSQRSERPENLFCGR